MRWLCRSYKAAGFSLGLLRRTESAGYQLVTAYGRTGVDHPVRPACEHNSLRQPDTYSDGLRIEPVPMLGSSLWCLETCLVTIYENWADPGLALSSHYNVTSSLL